MTATRNAPAKPGPVAAPAAPWQNRIVGSGEEAPDQLLANPANWRTHPAAQRNALRGSLDTVGWVQQVMVNRRTGFVVDGHARIEEALTRGEATVPVLYVDLSPEEEALVLATLDPIGAMAATDEAKLNELLAGVVVDDEGLRRLLGSLGQVPTGLSDPDAVPEVAGEVYVSRGDVWTLGRHRLMCGDSVDPADVARLLNGAEPRLLVTDPPYGVELDGTWRDRAGHNELGPAEASYMMKRTEGHRNTTVSGDTIADWSPAFELVPSLEVAYVWHASAHVVPVITGLERIGFEVRQQIIWVKPVLTMSRQAYHWQHEPCLYAVRKGKSAMWIGGHKQTTTWEMASPKMVMGGSTEEKLDHPTQKPIDAMARPIANHEGDVYEPFSGSGTTLIGAEMHGRRCYAMEIDPKYVQVAIERWQNFTGQKAVQA